MDTAAAAASASKTIIDQGVLGAALILTVLGLIFTVGWLRTVITGRLADAKESVDDAKKYASDLESMKAVMMRATAAQEQSTELTRALHDKLNALTEKVNTLSEIIRERMRH